MCFHSHDERVLTPREQRLLETDGTVSFALWLPKPQGMRATYYTGGQSQTSTSHMIDYLPYGVDVLKPYFLWPECIRTAALYAHGCVVGSFLRRRRLRDKILCTIVRSPSAYRRAQSVHCVTSCVHYTVYCLCCKALCALIRMVYVAWVLGTVLLLCVQRPARCARLVCGVTYCLLYTA